MRKATFAFFETPRRFKLVACSGDMNKKKTIYNRLHLVLGVETSLCHLVGWLVRLSVGWFVRWLFGLLVRRPVIITFLKGRDIMLLSERTCSQNIPHFL